MTSPSRIARRWPLYLIALVLVLPALLVGAARLLLPLVPQYQDDIRAWVSTATGYDIRFTRLTATWPLAGPRLSFQEVSLTRPGEDAPLLAAQELSAGLSVRGLLFEGRIALGHVAVRGARLRLERGGDGEWRVQGRRVADLLPQPTADRPPRFDVELAGIDVEYTDSRSGHQDLPFVIGRLRAEIGAQDLVGQLRIRPPQQLGRQFDLQLRLPLPLPPGGALPEAFDLRATGAGVEVPALLAFAGVVGHGLDSGRGDVTLEAVVHKGKAQMLSAELRLRDVALGVGGQGVTYQRIAGQGRWARSADGWEATLANLRIRRDGQDAPVADARVQFSGADQASRGRWRARTGFLRLDDLLPVARAVLAGTEFEPRLPRVLTGDLRDTEFELAAGAQGPAEYRLSARFERLGLTLASGEAAIAGLSGTAVADAAGGRLEVDSRDVGIDLAQWFREPLQASAFKGQLVWIVEEQGLLVRSEDLAVDAPGIGIRSRFELRFPAGDASPLIDLSATGSASEARQVLRYLPLRRFPAPVVGWLERAVVAGRVPQVTAELRGPLRGFPYDEGEGVFRVALTLEDGVLDYASGWPRIEQLDADVVFEGVGMYSTRNRARIGGLEVGDFSVRIADLRKGLLAVAGATQTPLDAVFGFLRASPQIARTLNPTLERVIAGGSVNSAVRLALPLARPAEYQLGVDFDLRGGELGLRRLPIDLKNLNGRVQLRNTRLSARGLRGVLMGEPVGIDLRPQPADSVLSHVAELSGTTPVARVMSTFGLPLRAYFDGRGAWQAEVRVPASRSRRPLSVTLRSDLVGVTSALPAPLGKSGDASWPAEVELGFPPGDVIEVAGRLEPPFSWALRLQQSPRDGWRIERGMLRAGAGEARLPRTAGVEISGRVSEVRLADWLALGDGDGGRPLQDIYRAAALQIDRLDVAGTLFRDVAVDVRRGTDAWLLAVKSPNAEGDITVPFVLSRGVMRLDMQRLWLIESAAGPDGDPADPREIPAMDIRVADAALGRRRLGSLSLAVEKTAVGVNARNIVARGRKFRIDGDASWQIDSGDATRRTTRLQASLQGSDIGDMLAQFGFDPVLAGKEARVSADLSWPGGPTESFLNIASGAISIEFRKGQVLDIEPGSGRILGLLSVTALPRRLALDFRDVFNEGMAFDLIRGDFRVGAGNAYTCNLGLSGPAADLGIIGRTGFAAEDYDQLAVVRPQVSNVLAVGGAVLGGPVGGVTMLLISQIFRKPLSTLGESYYRVSGSWDQPEVARVQRNELDAAAFKDCEREVAAALQAGDGLAPDESITDPAPQEPR